MKYKIVSLMLAVVMCVAFVPSFAFADDVIDDTQQETTEEAVSAFSDSVEDGEESTKNAFEDVSYDIADHIFTLSQSKYFYDGEKHCPDVICEELEEGTDYSVEYEIDYYGEYDPGTWYVYITGAGDYYGYLELAYKIVRTTIVVNKTALSLYRTGSYQLKVTVNEPEGKTTYKSSNTKVATVSSGGKINAKVKGTTTVTIKNGSATKTVKVTVKNPKLNATKASLYRNGNKTLKITGKLGKATFKSSNTKIATVNKSGKITAKKKGACTISVKTNGVTLKCAVTVKNPYLNKKSLTIVKNKKAQLKVIGKVGSATFKSSNSKVASVSKSGIIKAKKKGKCTITVKTNGITLKCKVRVKNPPPVYVYITRTGKRYHCDPDCWGLRNARALYKVTLSKAKKKGLTKCHVCYY